MTARLWLVVSLLGLALHSFAEDRDMAAALVASAEKAHKSSDYDTALSMCDRALQSDNTYPQAHFTRAQILETMNRAREAIGSYYAAAECARKENNPALSQKAADAARRLGPGLMDIATADQKLFDKLLLLGEKAAADEKLETAQQALNSAAVLQPGHKRVLELLEKVQSAINARGDPVSAKIAAVAMTEVWYYIGAGNKDKARQIATDITSRYSEMNVGKDAAYLLENDFDLSKIAENESATVRQQLVERQKQLSASAPAGAVAAAKGPKAPASYVNVDSAERAATEDANKIPKDLLAKSFRDHATKGRDFYAKATPGVDGNQQNLAQALDHFIRCEAIYLRMDELNLVTDEILEQQKQASMLRYACMKMTILQR
ncbi:MAG TPA: hypothetical protein VEJ63_03925 [Planctomycetota bacterium]|nr:hypothetical protein [Planctomycetota bacterium]